MFLSSGLDPAKEELRSSWWTRARWYRNSSGRLGMGPPGKLIAVVLLVDTSKTVQEQQRSTGHGTPRKKPRLLSEARTRAAGSGEVKTGEEEL